jgi:triacylglycerol lipase
VSANEKFPIVLAHGIARFDILRKIFLDRLGLEEDQVGDKFHYFKGIKSHLESNGFEVHHTSVDFAGRVETRATQLSEQIDQILSQSRSAKVHIIAHSMGGLDARHMIVNVEGMADKVSTLVTIGTPHLGTTFADFGITFGGRLAVDALRSIIHLEGFEDLTTTSCKSFNTRAKDQEANNSVVYQTYTSGEKRDLTFLPLQTSWLIIKHNEGENDGLVSIKSQQWEPELVASTGKRKTVAQKKFSAAADHLNEVGWWDPQETNPIMPLINPDKQAEKYENKIRAIYLEIARNL